MSEINDSELSELLVYSFRYVLGRASYAPSNWTEIARKHMRLLSRDLITREIDSAEREEQLGHKCDADMWTKFRDEVRDYWIPDLAKKESPLGSWSEDFVFTDESFTEKLTKLPGWDWRECCGMLVGSLRIEENMSDTDWEDLESGKWGEIAINDPATRGVLLGLLSRAHENVLPTGLSIAKKLIES